MNSIAGASTFGSPLFYIYLQWLLYILSHTAGYCMYLHTLNYGRKCSRTRLGLKNSCFRLQTWTEFEAFCSAWQCVCFWLCFVRGCFCIFSWLFPISFWLFLCLHVFLHVLWLFAFLCGLLGLYIMYLSDPVKGKTLCNLLCFFTLSVGFFRSMALM